MVGMNKRTLNLLIMTTAIKLTCNLRVIKKNNQLIDALISRNTPSHPPSQWRGQQKVGNLL